MGPGVRNATNFTWIIRSLLASDKFEVELSMLLIHFILFHFVSAKSFGDGNE